MRGSGATDFARDHRWARKPHWLLLVACLVPLLLLPTGCDTSIYSPPDQSTTIPVTIAPTTTTGPETTTTAVETTTTTLTPATTSSTTTSAPITTTTTTPAVVAPGTVLYEIHDWSGNSSWALTGQWKTVTRMLVADGTEMSIAIAPLQLGNRPDYAMEAEIQAVGDERNLRFYLEARLINGVGYWGGPGLENGNRYMRIGYDQTSIARTTFSIDGDWHTYRFEVNGNNLKLFFDGAEVARAMDNRVLEAGTAGIYCAGGQINVRAFRVIAL